MNDLINALWQVLSSDIVIAGLLVAAFVFVGVGGLVAAFYASIALTVSIYKHPDWKSADAVDFLAFRSFVTSVVFFAVIIATWLIPALIALPFSRDWIIATQFIVSAVAFIAAIVVHNSDLARLRRPPEP